MESLQPSELHALLGVFADENWDSDFEALLRPALKEQMVPEALRSKLDWAKPVRIIHNITLPEQRGSNSSVQIIPLHRCDLKLHIPSKHKEGMAKLIICYLHKLSHSKLSLCLAFDSFKYACVKLVLWLCRSGSGWTPLNYSLDTQGPSLSTRFINSQSSLCTQGHHISDTAGQHLLLTSMEQDLGLQTILVIWERVIQTNTLVHSQLESAGKMHLTQHLAQAHE